MAASDASTLNDHDFDWGCGDGFERNAGFSYPYKNYPRQPDLPTGKDAYAVGFELGMKAGDEAKKMVE